jgi:hypothetical protein
MRRRTQFSREFKAFLAKIHFKLKHFLPDDGVVDPICSKFLIARATGYARLRGDGGLTEELAVQWANRSNCFIAEALTNGAKPAFDGISFIDYDAGQPKVNWKKLVFLYEVERLVPIRIKIDDSIDDATVAAILAEIRALVGDIEIVVARTREGCTEITILVSRQNADDIIARFANRKALGKVLKVEGTTLPSQGSIGRSLLLEGPAIDLGRPDAPKRFGEVWRRALRIESVIRPWRRLRWLASLSIHSSPIARVIYESNDRSYTADLRGKWRAFKADVRMASITWPLFAALSLLMALLALHPFFPFIAVGAGVATGLVLALVGVQVCTSALSPIACGAGTIVMCWAFGLANAFAIGVSRSGESLSRSNIQNDFFVSITGGIVGLSAPHWSSRIPLPTVILLLTAIACAIAVAGWFMAQPTKAGPTQKTSRRRLVLGAMAGAGMGAGIGLVLLISKILSHLGCPQHIAFIAAFTLIGSATFASTIQFRLPRLPKGKLMIFALSYALIASLLCGLAYRYAGGSFGLLALAASTGWYHATWFTAASIVGDRIGSDWAAVIATTLEGAVGFTVFVVLRLLQV